MKRFTFHIKEEVTDTDADTFWCYQHTAPHDGKGLEVCTTTGDARAGPSGVHSSPLPPAMDGSKSRVRQRSESPQAQRFIGGPQPQAIRVGAICCSSAVGNHALVASSSRRLLVPPRAQEEDAQPREQRRTAEAVINNPSSLLQDAAIHSFQSPVIHNSTSRVRPRSQSPPTVQPEGLSIDDSSRQTTTNRHLTPGLQCSATFCSGPPAGEETPAPPAAPMVHDDVPATRQSTTPWVEFTTTGSRSAQIPGRRRSSGQQVPAVIPVAGIQRTQPESRRRILVAPANEVRQRTTAGMASVAQMATRVGGNVDAWQADYGRSLH